MFPTGALLPTQPITCSSYHTIPTGQLPSNTSRHILCIAGLSMLMVLTQITATGMIPNARNVCALLVTLIHMASETKQNSSIGVRRGDTRR
jgi:hypothetical protein